MGVPTFCPIHLKIHECPENSNKAISRATENKIKAKMSRMLNPTTTSSAPVKPAVVEKGTIQYILTNAKKNNENIKHKLGIENENEKTIGVDENDIKAKMVRLRAAVTDHQGVGQEINDHAYRVNRGIERIKNPYEAEPHETIINFDNNDLDQLNVEMQTNQVKKTALNASKQKKSTNSKPNSTQTRKQNVTNKVTTKEKNKALEPTIILTATEIEALIEKAVVKAIVKEKNNKKKRGE
ncbi:hypothetical protein M1771_04680 [Spiroplasma citri]|uniref:Uncharacterized protein n=1 Tax=Spiroplasma citri TaxID=2133 RepID=A0AAX3T0Z6_SPICI|nr:hypothetical protein [Spiroplasma citri]WFG97295.1 hypothetical protein M0C40_04695 [Spiroplasma citri]WFH01194.1 hypothetical protein M1771_04680 [Spiroplasma citri]